MSLEVEDTLVRALHEHNPWWDGGHVEDTLPRRRSDFYHLVRPEEPASQFVDQPVLGLVGRRGVGKTTLLRQFIDHQLQGGWDPERILYLPLDANPLYQLRSDDQLRRAIRYYESRILGRLTDPAPHVLVLDDVHRVEHTGKPGTEGWGTVVAAALEDRADRHVAVTASAGVQVTRELDRAGLSSAAYDVQPILPEKFRDYLFSLLPSLERGSDRVSPTPIRTGPAGLPRALETGDPGRFVRAVRDIHEGLDGLVPRIQAQLVEYLGMGGIACLRPGGAVESVSELDPAVYRRLRDDVRYALYQEVPDFETIRTIADLERLCTLAATDRGGDPLPIRACADAFDVDRRTLMESYLPALSTLYLLTGVTEFDNRRPRSVRLYLRDPGLVAALTGTAPRDLLADLERESDLARLVGFDHTMRLEYMINAVAGRAVEPDVRYWTGSAGEVEYVFTVDGTPVPVGLAYRPAGYDPTLVALEEFRERYDAPVGILLTGDAVAGTRPVVADDGIVTMPYWLYVLLC